MHPSYAGVAKWYTQLTQNQPVETPWGFESPRRHHIGASLVSLAPIFFQKVRVRSRRCSSFPNRTRSIGLRFGGASAGRNALILIDCRETTVFQKQFPFNYTKSSKVEQKYSISPLKCLQSVILKSEVSIMQCKGSTKSTVSGRFKIIVAEISGVICGVKIQVAAAANMK